MIEVRLTSVPFIYAGQAEGERGSRRGNGNAQVPFARAAEEHPADCHVKWRAVMILWEYTRKRFLLPAFSHAGAVPGHD